MFYIKSVNLLKRWTKYLNRFFIKLQGLKSIKCIILNSLFVSHRCDDRCQVSVATVTTATVTDYHCSCSESSYFKQCFSIGKVFDERGLDHHRIIIKFEKFQKKNGVINSYSEFNLNWFMTVLMRKWKHFRRLCCWASSCRFNDDYKAY